MLSLKFIPPEIAEEIVSKSDLLSYIQETHGPLKKSGKDFKGNCPACNHKSFSVNQAKDIAKCFNCGKGGHGAIGYLQNFFNKEYLESLHILAEHYNIMIPDAPSAPVPDVPIVPSSTKKKKKPAGTDDLDFRTQQLRDSGIPEEAQKYTVTVDGGTVKRDRFTLGSIDEKTGLPIVGHDMLMHYLSLDGNVITYIPDKGRKVEKPYLRIRYQHPELHLDKNQKPIRYHSPYGSANHLWIPEYIRSAFTAKETIDTLVFIEGEKKAESLCAHGIPAVGIAGIHNWATSNEMPYEIERLIITCNTTRVVMWYDSDLFDLGSDLNKNPIFRPATFASSAVKFRGYFDMYGRQDINIQIYLCYGLDKTYKGADDLIMALKELNIERRQPEGDDTGKSYPTLAADFNAALNKPSLKGELIKFERITSWSDIKIKQLWKVDSPSAFMEEYKSILKGIGEFKIWGIRWLWENNKFKCTQELYPEEQFWYKVQTKFGEVIKFDHYRITVFLQKRKFARYRKGEGQYAFIHIDNNVVREVQPDDVQEYVLKFAKALELDIEILRMLMQGGTQLVGADKLKNLEFASPPFIQPSRHSEILCFRDKYWLITEKEITEHSYQDLSGCIWKSSQIDFAPTYIKDYLSIDIVDEKSGEVEVSFNVDNSDWDKYIYYTSDIYHRDRRSTPNGWPATREEFTDQDQRRWRMLHAAMADKILATGYVVSKYFDPGELKAIMCVDAKESKVGKSEGRTGKSIYGFQFTQTVKVKKVNGKKKNLTEDPFLYDKVDATNHVIWIDDTRRDFDFEHFLSDITSGVEANWKGGARYNAGMQRFCIGSNHVGKDDDGSFTDRQYIIAFSDFFSPKRKPVTVFGHNLFTDWDDTQWNYYYNFVAHAIQQRLRLGLRTFAPDGDIQRRRLRAIMTETWLEFFEQYFFPGSDYMNIRHDIKDILDALVKQVPSQRMFAVKSIFKDKIKAFCKYHGWDYNIVAGEDGRIRNGSKNQEFFLVSDEKFNRAAYEHDIVIRRDIEAPLQF